MKKILYLSLVTISLFYLSGCACTGLTASSHVTNVQLINPNFKTVATNVIGEAHQKDFFGVRNG